MNRLSETVFRNGRLLLEEDDDDDSQQGNELCNDCGQPVRNGLGKFVNRIINLNGYKTRQGMGKPYPDGDYTCAECEMSLDDVEEQPGEALLQFPEQGTEE